MNMLDSRKLERNAKIVELRKAGLNYSEIGRLMGISHQRVTQIYERVVNGKTYPDFQRIQYDSHVYEALLDAADHKLFKEERKMMMSVTRAYNCLKRAVKNEEDMMDILMNADEEKLSQVRNLGRKSLDLIYEAREILLKRTAE